MSTSIDKIGPSPDEIRQCLIKEGVIPTPENAYSAFWSLRNEWWMQIVDGRCHKYGAMVFDKGLHDGCNEPGYIDGVKKAALYFTKRFHMDFSFDIYSEIHHIACAHFNGHVNNTVCKKEDIDKFNTTTKLPCRFLASDEYKQVYYASYYTSCLIGELRSRNPEIQERVAEMSCERISQLFCFLLKKNSTKPAGFNEKIDQVINIVPMYFHESLKVMKNKNERELYCLLVEFRSKCQQKLREIAEERVKIVSEEISKIKKEFCIENDFARCAVTLDNHFSIVYLGFENQLVARKIVKRVIESFNRSLQELQKKIYDKLLNAGDYFYKNRCITEYKTEATKSIAKLYATLEWLHCWIDGEGRTDLITLMGLLCREGANPAILEDPYYSSTHTIDEWNGYLKEGVAEFSQYLMETRNEYSLSRALYARVDESQIAILDDLPHAGRSHSETDSLITAFGESVLIHRTIDHSGHRS